ncbi:MAG: Flp pilus assembly protein CpaB [Dehalococcoidia bacterium]
MAMNAALDSSNANRKFIILAVVLGLLGAILIYALVSRDSSSDGGGKVSGATSAVVVAKTDIAARTKITADMLEVKLVPQDAVSEFSYADPAQVAGQVTRFPVSANQQVLSSQVISTAGPSATSRALSYTVPTGKRAFAVQANQVATAGGLILPGDYIDILAVYNVGDEDNFLVQTILQNIEVLAVSQTIVDTVGGDAASTNNQRARNTEAKPNPEAGTYTLALTPEQVQQMFLAESNGTIRFALRAFGDGTEKPIEYLTELDLIPDALP